MSKHVLNTRFQTGRLEVGGGNDADRLLGANAGLRHLLPSMRRWTERVTGSGTSAGRELDPLTPADDHFSLGTCEFSLGEDRHLADLYRRESPGLVRMVSRQTRNKDDAQDLVHDVFMRLARLGDLGPSLERPRAYLRRIASNLLKDRARSAARNSASLHVIADEETLAAIDPHRLLESRDMLRRLEAAIMRLRPKTREIFMAHRMEGLTYAQIAVRTGLSIKAVEKQMSKALVQLDRMLSRT